MGCNLSSRSVYSVLYGMLRKTVKLDSVGILTVLGQIVFTVTELIFGSPFVLHLTSAVDSNRMHISKTSCPRDAVKGKYSLH